MKVKVKRERTTPETECGMTRFFMKHQEYPYRCGLVKGHDEADKPKKKIRHCDLFAEVWWRGDHERGFVVPFETEKEK